MPELLTFGHGRLDRTELAGLLDGAGVQCVVDVRRFPGSRSNPAAARGQIEDLCVGLGLVYHAEQRLGGRRTLTREQDVASPDQWWQVAAFRAYAGWTRSQEWRAAYADLLARVSDARVAVMCSEAVWWRCHRRIIADVATLESGLVVRHLMHDGALTEHPVSDGARVGPDGNTVWDG